LSRFQVVGLAVGIVIILTASLEATAQDSSSSATGETGISTNAARNDGHVATLESTDVKDFSEQPAAVQRLLSAGLALTKQNLTYKYGSDDPQNGGMDCSGTVYHLLTEAGLKEVPRDSVGMYQWVWESGKFHAVVGVKDDTFELSLLRPGDLLFWTGTYQIDRDPNVTHVMIYLGINRNTGRRVMMGASDGRTFDGKSRYGVSVFDFKLASPGTNRDGTTSTSRFIGYGPVPGL
jgi:cell wall-associated NlpC family hydrolase